MSGINVARAPENAALRFPGQGALQGEAVKSYLRCREEEQVTNRQIIQYCRKRLAASKSAPRGGARGEPAPIGHGEDCAGKEPRRQATSGDRG